MARSWVAHRHAQNELARPFLLPMICEPRDYEYLPDPVSDTPDEEDDSEEPSSLALN